MERDSSGRRWAEAYLLRRTPTGPPVEKYCRHHPDTRLDRVLGHWICLACLAPPPRT
ncbi:hypothetical protein [Streptomyces silvensis]|nr:hypothetical protein [Streptomyces silvensis]